MTNPTLPPMRRRVRNLARAGCGVSAVMLAATLSMTIESPQQVGAVGVNAGAVSVVVPPGSPTAGNLLSMGGSATAFALSPPLGAACSGDSATGGFRVQTYMVPSSVDPGTLTFGLAGPLPAGSGTNYRQPLFTSAGSSWVNKTTGVTTGQLIGLPVLSFAWVADVGGITYLPAGTYNVGFACTNGGASATQLDRYWNTQLTIAASAADVPAGLAWTVIPATTPTTTTTTAATTTTTVAGATTTTVAGATTTTVRSGSTTTTTTTTTAAGGSTTTVAVNTTLFGSGAGSGGGFTGGTIVSTGSSPTQIIVWAILLLVFGRMALLLGRPLRVLPPRSQ